MIFNACLKNIFFFPSLVILCETDVKYEVATSSTAAVAPGDPALPCVPGAALRYLSVYRPGSRHVNE